MEVHHRRVISGYELPDEDHKKRISEILSAVPVNYRNWLEEELKYSNEISLRKRLKELLDKHLEVISMYVNDKRGFKNRVVESEARPDCRTFCLISHVFETPTERISALGLNRGNFVPHHLGKILECHY